MTSRESRSSCLPVSMKTAVVAALTLLVCATAGIGRLSAEGSLPNYALAAWATQLTYLQGKLLDRLGAECGPGLVRRIKVRTSEARPR